MLRAVLWDVDGTLAETERDGHRVAFNRAFESMDLPWRWDVDGYGDLLRIAGGEERLRADLQRRPDAPTSDDGIVALARDLHRRKNAFYAEIVAASGIALRPGVRRLIDACDAAGIRQAIATTTSRANVDALLASALGAPAHERFATIVCAEDAPAKKPDPLVYRIALQRLAIDGDDALAIEDSPNGVDAAQAAGIPVLVTRSRYFLEADYGPSVAICDDLDGPVRWRGGEAATVDVEVLRRIAAITTGSAPGAAR